MRQVENASRHKSEFLANMSHELRTPLNSIMGFSEVLKGETVGPLTPKQARYLGHIHQSGKHLLQLINDILDLSKVEAGKFVLEPQALPVATTLEDILVIARGLAHQKAQSIELEIEPDLPPLQADPVRFKQILFNLLSNAVKFTPEQGQITLVARRASAGGELLELRVTDTGIGIKAEDLPRLFQEFVQLEAAATKRYEGTGLGLALTKRLVELHGGRIRAESAGEGRGSTFTVVLPIQG
jgi:signal transduction histidine kinase